jgi:CHASE3 domain sensor protein
MKSSIDLSLSEQAAPPEVVSYRPGLNWLRDLNIGPKLTLAFGVLVALMLLVVGLSTAGTIRATENIDRTDALRVPTALAASSAQANLLRMQADVRGYLALGDPEYRQEFAESARAFEADLAHLQSFATELDPANQRRLEELAATYRAWSALPEELFDLRDDQLDREPAYRILATRSSRLAGTILIDIQSMIESQALQEPSAASTSLLTDMANFQGTFASMFSGLRGYVTTRNRIYRQEYEVNLAANQFAWERLNSRQGLLTPSQQQTLQSMAPARADFIRLAEEEIFSSLEGERWREDLYLFRVEALPLADQMQELLNELTGTQQEQLRADLNAGRAGLARANVATRTFGLLSLVFGVAMAFLFRENIAGPVRRLTGVADQIRAGDLKVLAPVESGDEIGILAQTFNNMTGKLRSTLQQVQKEKKRADDLLHVVIPIGIDLSSEKDFNRLLEKMLLEAKAFCRANAGILYLRTADNQLKFEIVRNDNHNLAMGGTSGTAVPYEPLPLFDEAGEPNCRQVATHAAVTATTINVADAAEAKNYDFSGPGVEHGYFGASFLSIPLRNSLNEVIGVLELVDPRDSESGHIVGFDTNLQQMMESFSSLAVAALEAYIREQSLRAEIQQLRIEIDEAKRQQQVSEIVDTDFFSELQAKAREIRKKHRKGDTDQ